MRQPTDVSARSGARSDHAHDADHAGSTGHGPGDALPAPYGRMFPDLAPGRPPEAGASHDRAVAPPPVARPDDDGIGRLVAHDLRVVADPAPGLLPGVPSPAAGPPTLGLDGLYGGGPMAAPHLYDPTDRARLRPPRVGAAGPGAPDPRRGLAARHDAVVDELRGEGLVFWPVVFSAARRRVVHGYQRRVLDELLPAWVGRPLVDAVRRHGRRFYRPAGPAFVPLELLAVAPWLAPALAAARPCPAPWTLPPGTAVAAAMEVAPLAPTDLDPATPLDEYVLVESHVVGGGRRLGPVGGRILAEVVVGILELDGDSCVGPLAPPAPTVTTTATALAPKP